MGRRGANFTAVLILIVLVMTACGNSGDGPAAETGVTRVYQDADGIEVEIPVRPERVVVLEYMGEALAVGAKPVGAAGYLIESFPGRTDGIVDVGSPTNLERVAELKPDLILSFDGSERESREQLEKIAPFVSVAWNDTMYGHVRAIADILGVRQAGEDWIAAYEAKAKAAAGQLQGTVRPGETAVAFGMFDKSFMVYEDRNIGHTLYHALGFAPPVKVKEMMDDGEATGANEISYELLPDYAADRLFVMLYGDKTTVEQRYEELKNSAVWQSLPAVKAGKVHVLGPEWFSYDALTLEWQLDETVSLLTQ